MTQAFGKRPFPFAFLLLPRGFGIMRHFVSLGLATALGHLESNWFPGYSLV